MPDLANNSNPFADFCELKLYVDEDVLCLGSWIAADLRLADAELEIGDNLISCGVTSAKLYLELEGCDIERGSKLNDEANQEIVELQKREIGSERGFAAGVSANMKKIAAMLNINYQNKSKIDVMQSMERRLKQVISEPNNSWRLVSGNPADKEQIISGSLLSNDPLFQLGGTSQSYNRIAVVAEVVSRRRDFRIKLDEYENSGLGRANQKITKERLLSILISKSVSGSGRNPNPVEKVVLSRSELMANES